MKYEIIVKEIPEIFVATTRFQGTYEDNMNHAIALYQKCKNQKNGDMFSMYYDQEYRENLDTECCMPIKKAIQADGIECKMLPAIRAVCTKHIGNYESIGNAYIAIVEFLRKNGLETVYPTRLVFEKGPGYIMKRNPEKYSTEVVFPIQ